jgi:hypothetical protein
VLGAIGTPCSVSTRQIGSTPKHLPVRFAAEAGRALSRAMDALEQAAAGAGPRGPGQVQARHGAQDRHHHRGHVQVKQDRKQHGERGRHREHAKCRHPGAPRTARTPARGASVSNGPSPQGYTTQPAHA